jgi:hypothetical protein
MMSRTFTQRAVRQHFIFFAFTFLSLLQTTTLSAQILYCPYCPVNWRDTIEPHAVCKTAITGYLDTVGRKFISPIALDNFSTDNCPVIIISASKTNFTCADVGTQNVILYVRDTAGNRAQCTTAVTIIDTIRPKLLKCAKDTSLSLAASECSKIFTFVPPTLSDNCSAVLTVSQTSGLSSGSAFPVGVTTVAFSAKDGGNNVTSCSFKVTVSNPNPKTLKCPRDTALLLGATECSKTFTYAKATLTDNCSASGTVTQASGLASGSAFPIGTNAVVFTAQDANNTSYTCSFRVVVADIPPTLVCKSKFAPKLSSASSRLVVTPFDVASSITDNCTPLSNLNVKIRRAGIGTGFPDSSSLSFACGDTGRIAVEIWVKDQSNLTSSCTTTIYVNDSNSVCRIPSVPALMGSTATAEGKAISAKIEVSSSAMSMLTQNSTTFGAFTFANLVRNSDYRVTPTRSGDWINGVTTFDVALMSRHVLNIEAITSPYKLIAADVNRDGSIDALDMLITRRIVLRQMDSFPNNRSWRFVPKSFVFPTTTDPLLATIPEFLTYTNLTDTVFNADFVAMKTGDLNGTATNTPLVMGIEPRGQSMFVLEAEDVLMEAGKTYQVVVKTPKFDPEAFQFTLNYDRNLLKFHSIDALDIYNFSNSNYAVFADRGNVTVSWNSPRSNAEPMNMFIFTLQATRPTRLSDALHLTSDLTPAEAYSSAGDRMKVDLRFTGRNTAGGDFKLYQNSPNPFKGSTTIAFRLPEDSEAKLTIFDETGRILKIQQGNFKKGDNTILCDFKDTPSVSGVLFYRLDTPTHSFTQRMILLN